MNERDFRRTLAQAGRAYVDAGVLALHLSAHVRYLPLTRALLEGLRDGDLVAFTSALSVYQLLVEPYRSGSDAIAEQVERLLVALPGLELLPLSAGIARQAAQVKAQIGGSMNRSLHIATALAAESGLYVTQRSALRRIAGLSFVQLDAHVGS